MKKIITLAIFLFLIFNSFAIAKQDIDIIAGTSILTSLVKDVAGNELKVDTLVLPSQCPASFDLKPDDALKIKNAKLVILHPFQKSYIEKINKINKKVKIEIFQIPDLTIPSNYSYGLYDMRNIIAKHFKKDEKKLTKNLEKAKEAIGKNVSKDLDYINGVLKKRSIKVICSKNQENFAKWLGFNVIATFAGPDAMSPKEISDIIKLGKKQKVKFIIGNLAGNHNETAKIFAKNLNAYLIVLSNFPEFSENESLFLNLWQYNINELKKYIK